MSLWIPITLAAAVFQTLRFMLQKTLSTGQLSAVGATFARFAYSAPLIWIVLASYLYATDQSLPVPTAVFWAYALVGGLSQILATICVVMLFRQRNFAVGITFKKTEVIQTAIVGFIVLGEGVNLGGSVAILLGLAAVLVLSRTPGSSGAWWTHLTNRASVLGLGSGVLFAFSAVGYRGATLQFGDMEPALRAAITLGFVVTFQALIMAAWLIWKDRDELRAVWKTRRVAVFVGLTSMGGSFCWFYAFTLQNAAYVKA
ncbi:MAG: EamA/RhaT family transporter, partial [Rhodobacteraceae bacterium]|nr:EamA/RhaT family transporter [Paracoccaceae bacterium]